MPTKIILDCDPGHDDASRCCSPTATPTIELVGVTTVIGNQTLEKVTRNALVGRPHRRDHRGAVRGGRAPPARAHRRGGASPSTATPGSTARCCRSRRSSSTSATPSTSSSTRSWPRSRARSPSCRPGAHQHRARRAQGAAHRRPGQGGRAHGRRLPRRQLERGGRVQHRDRPRGRAHRLQRAVAAHHGRARPHPPGAGDPGCRRRDRRRRHRPRALRASNCSSSSARPTRRRRASSTRRCTTRAPSRS